MLISQKCQYALWAVFELAWRNSDLPAKTQEIARIHGIPNRFLEVIMSQLRQGGFVSSRRGKQGGYVLARRPKDITVGEVITYLQGPLSVATNHADRGVRGDYAFAGMWDNVKGAVSNVYAETTFAELIEVESKYNKNYVPDYSI